MSGDERDDHARAGADWEEAASHRRAGSASPLPALAAPTGVTIATGRGQVTIDWRPVVGAAGYLVRREHEDGEFRPLEIGEPWVRPVPHPPLTDTTGTPGTRGRYTVAAVAAVDDHGQPTSQVVAATPATVGEALVRVAVDAAHGVGPLERPWRPMIGAEHLSQLDHGVGPGGRPIGDEFAEALRLAHDELGVRAVRAHAILDDDLGSYREVDGAAVHDFAGIDRIYDRVLELGLRPIVELSFMPRDLARDPSVTVFEYGAIISPPKDWARWGRLVGDLAAHLVERYGLDEVRGWAFEVWNEANLEVFWAGTQAEYFHLYDVAARAVKAVDAALPVGGPASAAVAWIDDTLDWARAAGAPVDFLSTHTYGNAPLDLRPVLTRHGFGGTPQWWTEWGAHATHFEEVHDSVWSAAYLVRGMASAMGRVDALAYWTVSDHFEELGRPDALLHGGFGLLSVGNLRKPRWWGLWMLEQLGDERLAVTVAGDGAGDMVNAIASADATGGVSVLAWNGTVDVSKVAGDPLLDREVTLTVAGLRDGGYSVRHRRLDADHSNLVARWRALGGGRPWPDDGQWSELRAADRLDDLEPTRTVQVGGGTLELRFTLPMPAVSLVELAPTGGAMR